MKYVYVKDTAAIGQSENIADLLYLFFQNPNGSIYLWRDELGEIHPAQRVMTKYLELANSANSDQPVSDGVQTL